MLYNKRVSFNTAKLAKQKGFDHCPRNYCYDSRDGKIKDACFINSDFKVKAPDQALLQKWLREEHNIHLSPTLSDGSFGWEVHCYTVNDYVDNIFILHRGDSYEDILERGLYESLKTLKDIN